MITIEDFKTMIKKIARQPVYLNYRKPTEFDKLCELAKVLRKVGIDKRDIESLLSKSFNWSSIMHRKFSE